MLRGRNNENILHMKELLFPWEKEPFVPAMQHGCRAKPLFQPGNEIVFPTNSEQSDGVYFCVIDTCG